MAGILRGEIYWASLNPIIGNEQAGLRPVLILSRDFFNNHSGTVIAVAITSQPQKAGFPLTLELSAAKLPKKSWAQISQSEPCQSNAWERKSARHPPGNWKW